MGAGAAGAYAFSIDLVSQGTWFSNQSSFATTEVVTFQITNPPGMPTLTDLYFEIPVFTGLPEAADGLYSNPSGDGFNFDASIVSISTQNNTQSSSGTWDYTFGAGAYSGLTGGGTFTLLVDQNTNLAFLTLGGDLEPAPEPATVFPILIGIAGLALRRRAH